MSAEVSFHWGNGIPADMKQGSFYINKQDNKMYLPTNDSIIEFSGAKVDISSYVNSGMSLSQSDWNMISSICSLGLASKYFQLGDRLLFSGSMWDVFEGTIIGFDHEGVPGITVMMSYIPMAWGTPFKETSPVWSESTTRQWLQTTYWEYALGDIVKKVIKPTTIKTYNVITKQFETTSDKVFALSQTELFGMGNQNQVEGTQYEYFKQQGITSHEDSSLLLEKKLFHIDTSYMNLLETNYPDVATFNLYLRGALVSDVHELISPVSGNADSFTVGCFPSLPIVAFRI